MKMVSIGGFLFPCADILKATGWGGPALTLTLGHIRIYLGSQGLNEWPNQVTGTKVAIDG